MSIIAFHDNYGLESPLRTRLQVVIARARFCAAKRRGAICVIGKAFSTLVENGTSETNIKKMMQ
jgi:hypothetical protein